MNDVFGRKLGHYILLEQLGEGGMAKVYNAFDSRMESNVAIKVILPSKRSSSVFLQQFEREAKALANLTHTNIVKVLNYGIQDGQPYLVMEYVSGGTLKEAMGQKIPWQTAAAILAPIARALDYVHRQQIVHRDVKPSNILLQEDFRPMLSDFGILKLLESKEEKVDSAIGAGIGTPEYMPPEQGMGKDVDFRADIYSLGLVFYEMITGQKPYTADSPMAIVIKHVTDELPLPTRIDKTIPKFVERAILRAVQKNPQNRYISMGHFADVLELIALGNKASPQKINRASREKEKRQRSRSIIYLSILLLVMVVGTSFFAINYFNPTQPSLTPTSPATQAITEAPTLSLAQTAVVLSTATQSLPATEVALPSVLTLLGTPLASNQGTTAREIARWGIGGVNVVEWSPDGETIALGTTSGIFLYNAETKEPTLFIDTQFNVLEISFNPGGDLITAGSPKGIVQSWNIASGTIVQSYIYARPNSDTITNNLAVTSIAYSLDGEFFAVGYKNGAINYFRSDQSNPTMQVENYPSVEDLVISPDKRFIYASNGSNAEIDIWDIQTAKKEKTPLTNPTPINTLSISPDQQYLLAGGSGNSVYLWNLSELKQVSSFPNLGGTVTDFDVSFDSKYAAIGLKTGEIKVFAIPAPSDYSKTHVPIQSIKGYQFPILGISFAPDQLTIASGNIEEGLKLWDAQSGENTFSLDQSRRAIDEIYISSDGAWIATSHADRTVRVWDVNGSKEVYTFDGYLPKSLPFSPDNTFLAYVFSPGQNKDSVIRVIKLATGEQVAELTGYIQKSFVQFREDSNLLVIGDAYKATLWDVATWEQVDTIGGPNAGCGQYYTPQGNLLTIINDAGIFFKSFDDKMQAMCGTAPKGATLMYYFYNDHSMLFVLGKEDRRGSLWTWDFRSTELGRIQSDDFYPESSKIFLAGDQANGDYAYVDITNGNLNIKNINGGGTTIITEQSDYQYRVALLPGKNLMALGSRYGSIHVWVLP